MLARMTVQWIDDRNLTLRDVSFHFMSGSQRVPPAEGQLFLFKTREMIERYMEFLDRVRPDNVVELGIFGGGSTAFLSEYLEPKRHVAVELRPTAGPAFDAWLRDRNRDARTRVYFGVDQADKERLAQICAAEFGVEPIDFVIDDASHAYAPTRASFEVLFPRLRPEGWYVIEDWAPQLGMEALLEGNEAAKAALGKAIEDGSARAPKSAARPLEALVVELVLLCAGPGLIDEVHIRPGWAAFRRSAQAASSLTAAFDVGEHIPRTGRLLVGLPSAGMT